ncbi:glycosyltransferase family 2 protein [Marinovum sp. 2_MG-2023]|uniref:glycosyltransferase family 2 protein n=1 Tax=unclassified Marinovum TaxID=2647166 RepID=UPI0026E1CE9B|nr:MULTISPECIES: glycosyltransferase family 2 protein [unclassified Marinovum]MDO6732123.1 glycosyltransferase family 2 protein [Marinovum sp. 2_MG-2023]MDO6781438.1 glycosyltransferase family 2 protein [Marinovum sp. 1_MG-2023]
MQKFRAAGGGSLTYRLDFTQSHFANISFFDAPQGAILFHLSLRHPGQLAVVNARPDGTWQAERTRETVLAEQGDIVTIHFRDGGVQVMLNDTEIFTYITEFPNLDRIGHFTFQGAIVEDSLTAAGAGNAERQTFGALSFVAPLQLEGWGGDPGLDEQTPHIRIEGVSEAIRCEIKPRPGHASNHKISTPMIGVTAALPGRVWLGVAPDAPLRMQVFNNGLPCGAVLELDRAGLVAQIQKIVQGEGIKPAQDILLAIEHLRFAGIRDQLPPTVLDRLEEAAGTYGVMSFLSEGQAGGAVPRIAPLDPEELVLRQAQRDFALAVKTAPAPNLSGLLEEVIERYRLTPRQQRDVFLGVTDAFCSADDFRGLYRYVASLDLHRFTPQDESMWHNSVILPFLYMEGRLGEVVTLLQKMARAKGGWCATPAIAWVVRDLLEQSRKPATEKEVEDLLRAFMEFIERRSERYWDRAPCAALVDAAVALVRARHLMVDGMAQGLERFAVRNYGLSPRFWEKLGSAALEDSVVLGTAAAAFGRLQAAALAGEKPEADDFAVFEAVGTPDVARFRLELLGPSGQTRPATGAALATRLRSQGNRGDEAALRMQAFPGRPFDRQEAEALKDLTRAAIRRRYFKTAKAPFLGLQQTTSREATALLADLARPEVDELLAEARLVRLLDNMTALSSQRSRFVGIGMMLALLNGVQKLGNVALATQILARISGVRAELPTDHQLDVYKHPALRSALMALVPAARQHPTGLARSALALFPNFNPEREMPTGGARADWSWTSSFFNTVIMVMSCKANLPTRIAKMRETWLARLSDLAIPYVIVVGDGDGSRDHDLLSLNVPDDYESLPQKTLAAIRWVRDNTDFAHMLKIDDDCFLDAETLLHNQSYRKFDYYGRRLRHEIGETDRSWHCAKSSTARGQLELDRSPAPSEYADGGNGYMLSRHAMSVLLEAAESPEGRRLINTSFMEDKTVGDLLATRGIHVQDEDYQATIRRRTHSDGQPVPMWFNSFYPGPSTGISQIHLDSTEDQDIALDRLSKPGLFPKKIWPTFAPVKLGHHSGALELISSEAQLTKVNDVPVAVVACLRNEMFMLKHFLAHYRALGVGGFLMIDNGSDDGSLEYLLEQPDVAVFSTDTDYNLSRYGVAWQMAIVGNLRVGRWSLLADIDELLVYRGWKRTGLPKLLAGKGFNAADAVRINMLDMYPQGPLSEATFANGTPFDEAGYVDREPFLRETLGQGPYSDASTITSALRHRLMPGTRPDLFVAQKYALVKYQPWMRLSDGLHYGAEIRRAAQEMIFAHFKYTAHFLEKAQTEVARGQHFNNAEEYRRYLALAAEGREVIHDPAISVPWMESPDVKALME